MQEPEQECHVLCLRLLVVMLLLDVLFLILFCLCYRAAEQIHPEGSRDNATESTDDVVSHASERRDRRHIDEILQLNDFSQPDAGERAQSVKALGALVNLYESAVAPMEVLYRYQDLGLKSITAAKIHAKPLILFLGPWSTGKSTIINYLLDLESDPSVQPLYTGAEPTTTDFTVLQHGAHYRAVEGLVLASDTSQEFCDLHKYGQAFLEKLQSYEYPSALLERVTVVDTPGIIENRQQQQRGYPFSDVTRWFIDRADLILIVFDPSKLDVGSELEAIFRQLKGHESQLRIILNKADSISSQELMRVYGALFWNFAPLINVVEPPRVYVGSYWSHPLRPSANEALFLGEERSLVQDVREVVVSAGVNKVATVRQHAHRVLVHALLMDKYIEVFSSERTLFGDNAAKWSDIIARPSAYHVYESVASQHSALISPYDLPPPERYRAFFHAHSLALFARLSAHCRWFTGCPLDRLRAALLIGLPRLLSEAQCAARRRGEGPGGLGVGLGGRRKGPVERVPRKQGRGEVGQCEADGGCGNRKSPFHYLERIHENRAENNDKNNNDKNIVGKNNNDSNNNDKNSNNNGV